MVVANPATLTEKSYLLSGWATFRRAHLNTQSRILARNSIIFNGRVNVKDCFFDDISVPEYFKMRYLSLLAKHPVITKSITSALLTLVGDLICQLLIDRVPSPDLKRTFIFTLLGLVMVGPTLHFWYLYLSKLVTTPGASGAFLRLLLDQFIFAPIFIGTFLSTLVTLEGRPSNVIPKLKQEWFSSVLANWQLWIPFQFLNFWFVPQQFQVFSGEWCREINCCTSTCLIDQTNSESGMS
ncbi:Peroxisomal membrane 22 kDa family protein [Perilla frutescens var. frutescens]|nr:Peroxisomal membrane 22 kDa family protein [Perilla frutescens var. frutescens]